MQKIRVVLVFVLSLGIGCEFVEGDGDGQEDTLAEFGFSIEIVEARFLAPSLGKNRLYVLARLVNDSEPQDLVMAVHRLPVVTDGAGTLRSGFHDPSAPEEVELCPTNDNGRAVPTGSIYVCGFVVESESDFQPLRLEYWSTSLGTGPIVEDDF